MLVAMAMILISTLMVLVFVLKFLNVLRLVGGSFVFTPEAELAMGSDDGLGGPMESSGSVILDVVLLANALVDA